MVYESIHVGDANFLFYFARLKLIFLVFYFTYLFVQNTQINLFILHIYTLKYSFFTFFILFSLIASLSLTTYLSLSLSLSLSQIQPPLGATLLYIQGFKWTPWIPKNKKELCMYIYIFLV